MDEFDGIELHVSKPDLAWSSSCTRTTIQFIDDIHGCGYNPRKRTFDDYSESESDAQEEAEGSNKKSFELPFACPYYKNNQTKNYKCSGWRDSGLSRVKHHLRRIHIKPLRCGRCKSFRAGDYEQVTHHLMHDDCMKSETRDTYDEASALKQVEKVEKAETWEKIYSILFPDVVIPSPFWKDETEVAVDPPESCGHGPPLTLRFCAELSCNKRTYQHDLGEYLQNQITEYLESHIVTLQLPEGYMGDLLQDFDQRWIKKASAFEERSFERESRIIKVGFSQIHSHRRRNCHTILESP